MQTATFTLPGSPTQLYSVIFPNGQNRPATINFHEDGGHGWLEVPKYIVKALGIAEKISGYSYMKDDRVYLEEDCDLSIFLDALTANMVQIVGQSNARTFFRMVPRTYKDRSPIRNYDGYSADF